MTEDRSKRIRRRALQAIACGVALALASPVHAGGIGDQLQKLLQRKAAPKVPPNALAAEPPPPAAGAPLTLDDAVAQVRRERPEDEIVRAETREQGERRIHEVRALGPDGKLRTFRFDAASGERLP
jgi:hypothetical protein